MNIPPTPWVSDRDQDAVSAVSGGSDREGGGYGDDDEELATGGAAEEKAGKDGDADADEDATSSAGQLYTTIMFTNIAVSVSDEVLLVRVCEWGRVRGRGLHGGFVCGRSRMRA